MHLVLRISFLLLIQFIFLNVPSQGDDSDGVSSSIASIEELLQVERKAVFHLEDYIKKLEHKIGIIRSVLGTLRKENEKWRTNEKAYLLSPSDAFSLIHRQHFDWYGWDMFLQKPVGYDEVEELKLQLTEMPNYLELTEAVDSIYRLQILHYITANDMTNGILNGRQYDARFSAFDAFAIARTMFNRSHYEEANEWIEEALRLYEESPLNDIFESNRRDLYALYAEIQLKLGYTAKALKVMNNALTLEPFNLEWNQRNFEMELESYAHFHYSNKLKARKDLEKILMHTAASCRDRFPLRVRNLSCHLYNKGNFFVKLAPFKMEVLSLDPYMVKFYDVISKKEIVHLKEISRHSLKRSKVAAAVAIEDNTKNIIRISKSTWIKDNFTKIVSNINERISDMTGFDLKGSEHLHISNYGLAGHFLHHFDQISSSGYPLPKNQKRNGDRIATLLIYMSEVMDGGETIFPAIKEIVKPQEGTALLWYNLDDRGNSDPHVGHMACPVVVGSKWVATKWIRERNQFRVRPCLARK